MKLILSLSALLCILAFSSCKTTTILVQHINPQEEATRFMDSLQAEGVDTIIGYYDGCSGCIRGFVTTYYIYWYSKEWYLTKFSNYSRYNVISSPWVPINFISENLDSLENGKLMNPAVEWSHYSYHQINVVLPEGSLKFEVEDFQARANPSNEKVILIDKIRSGLLDVRGWKGLSYRFEKVRMD